MARSYYRSSSNYGWVFIISCFVIFILAAIGWVANIVQLIQMDAIMSGLGAVRIAGIPVAPLGSVLGWIGIFGVL